jgi:hypothetical protein
MVSVNASVSDRERVLSQAVSQIRLTNARASTKYNVLLHQFNKPPLAKSATKSKMPFVHFCRNEYFSADGTLVNLIAAFLANLDADAQITPRETAPFVTVSVTVHPKQLSESFRTPSKTLSSAMFELPRDPLLNSYTPSLHTLLHPSALMAECKASPGHLKLVQFNGGGNPM